MSRDNHLTSKLVCLYSLHVMMLMMSACAVYNRFLGPRAPLGPPGLLWAPLLGGGLGAGKAAQGKCTPPDAHTRPGLSGAQLKSLLATLRALLEHKALHSECGFE